MIRTVVAFVLTTATFLGAPAGARGSPPAKSDPGLLNALRSDRELAKCGCILAALWLDESYPRVVVDAARWKALNHVAQATFSRRALQVAEATFLTEFGVEDQYQEIFIVDAARKPLMSYHP